MAKKHSSATNAAEPATAKKTDKRQPSTRARAREDGAPGIRTGRPTVADDHARLLLAAKAFDYFVKGMQQYRIAEKLGIHRTTVSALIKEEGERRHKEFMAERHAQIQRSAETYRTIEAFYLERMYSGQAKGDEGTRAADAAAKVDKLLGLAEPERIEVDQKTANRFEGLDTTQLYEMMRKLPDTGPFKQNG